MRTRKEIEDGAESAIKKTEGNEMLGIMILLATQIELLADIRELLTYGNSEKPGVLDQDVDAVVRDMMKTRAII